MVTCHAAVEQADSRREGRWLMNSIDKLTRPICLLEWLHTKEEARSVLRSPQLSNGIRVFNHFLDRIEVGEHQNYIALRKSNHVLFDRDAQTIGHGPQRRQPTISDPHLPPHRPTSWRKQLSPIGKQRSRRCQPYAVDPCYEILVSRFAFGRIRCPVLLDFGAEKVRSGLWHEYGSCDGLVTFSRRAHRNEFDLLGPVFQTI